MPPRAAGRICRISSTRGPLGGSGSGFTSELEPAPLLGGRLGGGGLTRFGGGPPFCAARERGALARKAQSGEACARTVGDALRFALEFGPTTSATPLVVLAICGSFTVLQFGQRTW